MRILRSAQNDEVGTLRMTEEGAFFRPVHPLSPAAPDSSPVQGELCWRAGSSRPTQRRTTLPPCHSEAVRPKNP